MLPTCYNAPYVLTDDSDSFFGTHLVYDVSNRESFDALPRWYSELETYVSSSVVKIVVGNKVDKVRLLPRLSVLLSSHSPLPQPTHPTPKEFSRQVSPSEGQAFATRMSSLFIEASAKTAVGVREAFQEVVERILDTPELWAPVGGSGGEVKSAAASANVDLRQGEVDEYSGCSC